MIKFINAKLNNEEGSMILYILVLVAIVVVITGSLMATAAFQYKLSAVNKGMNKSFYINDGAVEEALAEIAEFSSRTEVAVNNTIMNEKAKDHFTSQDKWKLFKINLNALLYSGQISNENANDLLAKAMEWEFNKQYIGALLNDNTLVRDYKLIVHDNDGNGIYELDQSESSLLKYKVQATDAINTALKNALETVTFNPGNLSSSDSDDYDAADTVTLTVKSEYLDDGALNVYLATNGHFDNKGKLININKKMEAKVKLIVPEYKFITASESHSGLIYRNDVLGYSLVSNKDIIVTGGTVTVNGQGDNKGGVYAFGTIPAYPKNTSPKRHTVGGIIIGYNDNTGLTEDAVNTNNLNSSIMSFLNKPGSLITNNASIGTRASISVYNTNSNLKVSDNVYANNFAVHRNREKYKADNFTANIGKNVYLYEDLYIGGDNASITIGDGNTGGELNCLLDHNPEAYVTSRAGSITMIGTHKDNEPVLTLSNLLIAGRARMDMYQNKTSNKVSFKEYFESGESYTTGNNFEYYRLKLQGQKYTTKTVSYLQDNPADPDNPIQYNNVYELNELTGTPFGTMQEYRAFHFYDKGKQLKTEYDAEVAKGNNANPITVNALSKLIVSDHDKSAIRIRSMDLTDNDTADTSLKANLTAGVFQGSAYDKKTDTWKGYVFLGEKMNLQGKLTTIFIEQMIDQYTHLLGYFDYSENTTNHKSHIYYDSKTNQGQKDQHLISWKPAATAKNLQSGKQIIYYNSKIEDVYVNLPVGVTAPSGATVINSYDLEGLVVTRGNVYIYAPDGNTFNFKGNIVSDKSIIFYGGGDKNINYNEMFTYETIFKDQNNEGPKLLDIFGCDSGRKLGYNGDVTNNFTGKNDFKILTKDSDFTKYPRVKNDLGQILMESGTLQSEFGTIKKSLEGYEIQSWKEIN